MKPTLTILFAIAFLLAGCGQGFPYRNAPTEPQKALAELTLDAARALEGHVYPAAEGLRELVEAGSAASSRHMGPTSEPVNKTELAAIVAVAKAARAKLAAALAATVTAAQGLQGKVYKRAEPARAALEAGVRDIANILSAPATPMPVPAAKTIEKAMADAARPPPDPLDVFAKKAEAAIDRGERIAGTGFGLLDSILTIGATLAGSYGALKIKRGIDASRAKLTTAEKNLAITTDALRETIHAVDVAKTDLSDEAVTRLTSTLKGVQSTASRAVVKDLRKGTS